MRRLRIIHKQPVTEETSLEIDANRMVEVVHKEDRIRSGIGVVLCGVREVAGFANRAIWLNGMYDWELGTDSQGRVCVVPLEKS